MDKLEKGLILSGIFVFCLTKFVEQFSKENGNPIELSWLIWISVGVFLLGIIIYIVKLIRNKK